MSEEGTLQGAVISPVLANIYLYYVFDLWAQAWRTRHTEKSMIIVRYADDIVCGFKHARQAKLFMADLRERLGAVSSLRLIDVATGRKQA